MEFDSVESICNWSTFEVAVFVSRLLGTDMYSEVLNENQVNGKLLLSLRLEGLKKVGITALVHRHALYGWAQDRIYFQQEQINMQRRKSMESSNKGSNVKFRQNIEVFGEQILSDNNLAIRENEEMRKPVKSFLKENHGSQSRTFSRNLRTIRSWFHQGAGGFSQHELLHGNIKKNPKLKDAIMDIIRKGKKDIEPICINKRPYYWIDSEIFNKVQQHRNYLKSSKCKSLKPDDELNQLANKVASGGSSPTDVVSQHGGGISRGLEVEAHSYQGNSTYMTVSMFASKIFIPEQVIQYRQENLAARGAVFKFSRIQGFDDQMIGFGCGNLLHRHLGGPYERWEIQMTDLCIGIYMPTLLLPGTHRAASTVHIGERVMLPAVYLSLGECVPDSIESTQDNQAESLSIPSHEETLQVKLGNFSSELVEKLSFENCSDFHENCQSQEHATTSYTKILVQDEIGFNTLDSDNESGNFKCSSKDQSLEPDCYYVDLPFEAEQSEDGGIISQCAKNQEPICLEKSKDPTNDFQPVEDQVLKRCEHKSVNQNVDDSLEGREGNNLQEAIDNEFSGMLHTDEGNGIVAENLFRKFKSLAQKAFQNNCSDEGCKNKSHSTPQTTFLYNKEAIGGNNDENKEDGMMNCNVIKEDGKKLKKRKFISMNSMLTPQSSNKAMKLKACETFVKKKALGDATNRLPQNVKEDSARHVERTITKFASTKVQKWHSSNCRPSKFGSSMDVEKANAGDVELEKLTREDKYAILLKFLGENDVDSMYGDLHNHLKRVQKEHKVEFVGIKGSTKKETMVDTIVAWGLSVGNFFVERKGIPLITQDVVSLS